MEMLMTQGQVAEALGYKNAHSFAVVRYKNPERYPEPDRYIGKSPRWKASTIESFIGKSSGSQA